MFVSSVNNFSWANLCFPLKGKSWVWVAGGKLSSPFALNIKPLVLRFALRVRSEEHRMRGKGERERERYWREEYQARCQVSDFKVLLRGCTAGTDKDNPKVSWQFWKEITFDSERKFLTCRMNNLNYALMSLSINKLSLRNVVYGVITWSCSLCCCPCAIILWRACPQMSRRTWLTVSLNYGWIMTRCGERPFPSYRVTVSKDMLWFILENST